jgi:hypothetical protein
MRNFPDPLGGDGPGLQRWASTDEGYRRTVPVALQAAPVAGDVVKGVNLVGYHAGQFGVGEAGRLIAKIVRAAGVPTATTTLYPPEHTHAAVPRTGMTGAPFDYSIFTMNADGLMGFAGSPEFRAHTGHRVGVWAWEAGLLPPSMRSASHLVDEVWCATDYVQSLLAPVIDRPVRKHPLVIDVPTIRTALQRSDLGLPEAHFLFGFAFDYASVLERKNPLGLIDAYCDAFGPEDGAALVLKTLNALRHPMVASALHHAADRRPDIVVLDQPLPAVEMRALFQLLDCYVSLHRAEGTGLTMTAAMAAGTPCVATGWSGNLEFMTEENSMLVPYELVEVGRSADPYAPDAVWAEPDLSAAAAAMRSLFDDREAALALGARGRASIASLHNAGRAAAWFMKQFDSPSARTVAA